MSIPLPPPMHSNRTLYPSPNLIVQHGWKESWQYTSSPLIYLVSHPAPISPRAYYYCTIPQERLACETKIHFINAYNSTLTMPLQYEQPIQYAWESVSHCVVDYSVLTTTCLQLLTAVWLCLLCSIFTQSWSARYLHLPVLTCRGGDFD